MDSKLITSTTAVQIATVEAEVEQTLVAEFVYDPADACAVTMVIQTMSGPVNWTFARELLVDGQYEPTGDGDVHVWPCLNTEGCAVVILELSSPSGEVLVQVGSRQLASFIQQMVAIVPVGSESTIVDLDAEIAQLLSA
jgi:hypothetical protein